MSAEDIVDVVVLGSGASGLAAAVAAAEEAASVAVLEKADLIGGTTAMSGGIVWMPGNHHQEGAGVTDTREMALAYLESLSLGQIDSDMAATFVDEGPDGGAEFVIFLPGAPEGTRIQQTGVA